MDKILRNIEDRELSFCLPTLPDFYKHFGDLEVSQNQAKLIHTLENNRFVIIKKARQVGETSLTTAYLAKKMLTEKSFNITVIANNRSMANYIISRVIEFVRRFGRQFGGVEFSDEPREDYFRLTNGSDILGSCGSADAFISRHLDLVYFSEAAFIQNLEEMTHMLVPALDRDGKVIIASTPNGVNTFRTLYYDAFCGKSDYVIHDMPIDSNPLNTPQRIEEKCSNFSYNKEMIAQEIYAEFIEKKIVGDIPLDQRRFV